MMARSRRTGAPAAEPVCTCRRGRWNREDGWAYVDGPGQPLLVAVFVREHLVRVERHHWSGRDRCRLGVEIIPAEVFDPAWRAWDGRDSTPAA